ncbi:putative reverse transcriptase domain-containing protein [Tanacetum coccineum]
MIILRNGREQEEAFQTLKDNLCNAPILPLLDGPEDFVVYCDASNQGLGCVLMQRGKRQGRERDNRNAAWPEPTNGKEGMWSYHSSIRCAPFEALFGRKYRSPVLVEVGDKVMLEVSSWKDVLHFGKKDLLTPRYYWTDANLHVHVEEIKVDKTLRFAEEPVEIIDREVKSLKRSRIPIVKSIGT